TSTRCAEPAARPTPACLRSSGAAPMFPPAPDDNPHPHQGAPEMTTTERIWMTPQAQARLRDELTTLRSGPGSDVPNDATGYDDILVADHAARQARIRRIQDLLANAAAGEDPPDDGVAEPGMVLTVCYDDTGDIETFLLGVRGAEDAGIEVYSLQS